MNGRPKPKGVRSARSHRICHTSYLSLLGDVVVIVYAERGVMIARFPTVKRASAGSSLREWMKMSQRDRAEVGRSRVMHGIILLLIVN